MDTQPHPTASFWLDVADKAIKGVAVLIGAWWTYWNYRKSRTYEEKIELEISGTVFTKRDLYGDVRVVLKNIGATEQTILQSVSYCELLIVRDDLTETSIRLFDVFTLHTRMEPNETIDDTLYWRIPRPVDDIVWVKLRLRVATDRLEWNTSCMIRVEAQSQPEALQNEVI